MTAEQYNESLLTTENISQISRQVYYAFENNEQAQEMKHIATEGIKIALENIAYSERLYGVYKNPFQNPKWAEMDFNFWTSIKKAADYYLNLSKQ